MFLWRIIIISSIESGARPNTIIVYGRCHLACHLCSHVTSEQYRSTIIYWAKFIWTTDVSNLWSYAPRFYCSFQERGGGEVIRHPTWPFVFESIPETKLKLSNSSIDKLCYDENVHENAWTSSKFRPTRFPIPSLTKILLSICSLPCEPSINSFKMK